MHDSIPEQITGTVQLQLALADEAGAHSLVLADLVTTWIHAVEVGLFGEGKMRLTKALEARGRSVIGGVRCECVATYAFRVLARMVRHFSNVTSSVESTLFYWEEGHRNLQSVDGAKIPSLPSQIPFTIEKVDDFHADVRVEIGFKNRLSPLDKEVIFDALSRWDTLIESLADEARWDEECEHETRMMSPFTVEHVVNGFFADPACFDLIVHMGLRLHRHLPIERMVFE